MAHTVDSHYIRVNKKAVLLTAAAIAALVASVALASYVAKNQDMAQAEPYKPVAHSPYKNAPTAPKQVAQAQPQQPACNDSNIIGTAIGGIGGGVLGSQIGSGSGKTAATIGGALGGAYLGNQYIPTRNATCK